MREIVFVNEEYAVCFDDGGERSVKGCLPELVCLSMDRDDGEAVIRKLLEDTDFDCFCNELSESVGGTRVATTHNVNRWNFMHHVEVSDSVVSKAAQRGRVLIADLGFVYGLAAEIGCLAQMYFCLSENRPGDAFETLEAEGSWVRATMRVPLAMVDLYSESGRLDDRPISVTVSGEYSGEVSGSETIELSLEAPLHGDLDDGITEAQKMDLLSHFIALTGNRAAGVAFGVNDAFDLVQLQEPMIIKDTLVALTDCRIAPCLYCGGPSYVANPKRKQPFCRRSHQVRYNERAKQRFREGVPLEGLVETFPGIKRRTLENWYQDEGNGMAR